MSEAQAVPARNGRRRTWPSKRLGHLNKEKTMGQQALRIYWSGARGDNFTTATDAGERDAKAAGYQFVRDDAYVLDTAEPGTTPLQLFWSEPRGDNITAATQASADAARAAGYVYVRDEGHVHTQQVPGTVPLKMFWSPEREDNFTAASAQSEADALGAGYRHVRDEGYVFAAPAAPVVTRFPIIAEKEWQQSAMHMRARLGLSDNGTLHGYVNTWSTWWLRGFTGGVVVFVCDSAGNVLWTTTRQYGVDGTGVGVFGTASNRTDWILENLGGDVASRAHELVIGLSHMPKNRLKAIVNQVTDGAKTVFDGVKEIAAYVGA